MPPAAEAPAGGPSNGVLRVLTAAVGLPVVVGAVWLGGWWLGGLVALIGVLAQRELYALGRAAGTNPLEGPGLAAGALVALAPLAGWALPAAGAVVAGLLCAFPFRETRSNPVLDAAVTLGGVLYPTALLATLTALRLGAEAVLPGREAFWLTLAVFLLVFATDTAAYYTGRAVGKRPLAPKVSPKKTWEGAAGGALGAVAVAVLLKATVLPSLPWAVAVGLALVAAAAGPMGDLAESRFKRAVGVKDSGTLLPGHGGLLDRFDALTVVAPLAYALLALTLGL